MFDASSARRATFERKGSALRVAVARCEASDVARWAEELASLETRVLFTVVASGDSGATRFECLVWVENPHGREPRPTPLVIGRALQSESESSHPELGSCLCGAKHVAFISRKSYPGQDRDDLHVPCLACGRGTFEVLGVPDGGGVEIHLVDRLPPSRARWLPRESAELPGRRDSSGILRQGAPLVAISLLLLLLALVFVVLTNRPAPSSPSVATPSSSAAASRPRAP